MVNFLEVAVLVALFCKPQASEAVSNGCSNVCEYQEWGKDASCQRRNLSYVPQECRQAKTLRLEDNLVKLLPEGVFSNFTSLKYLYLERNGMELQRGAFKGCSMLVQIRLNDNHLPTLTPETMDGLTDKLQVMFVDNTGVVEILSQAFEDLTQLQYLSLKNNKLTIPPCNAFSSNNSLSTLYLTNNSISQLPDDCFAVFHQLKKLYLKNNPLREPNGLAFRGLVNLRLLDFQYTNLTQVPTGIFPHANKIETLYLSFNHIHFLNSRDFASLFGLRNLYLQQNMLVSLHQHSFEFLSSLQIIDLSHNMIRSIEEGVFNELEHLSDLRLHHNQLNSTKNITFSTISSESKVWLSHNPLHCDCSIYPFHYWLKSSRGILSTDDIHSSYLARCFTPRKFYQHLVRDLDPSDMCANIRRPKITSISAAEINLSPPTSKSHNMANPVYEQEDIYSSEALSNVQLITIIVGCIVCFILIVGGFIVLFMKRRSDKKTKRYGKVTPPNNTRPMTSNQSSLGTSTSWQEINGRKVSDNGDNLAVFPEAED